MNTKMRNLFLVKLQLVTAAVIAVLSILAAPNFASAAVADDDGDTKPVRAHKDLEIYTYEAADKCDPKLNQVRMTVVGGSNKGMLTLELYQGANDFLSKDGRVRRVRVPAQKSPQMVCMTRNELGVYAVAGYHDIDANRKLKKSFIKLPREPFALSNNPEIKALKFPKFEDSAFTLGKGGINITLELVDLKKQKKAEKAARALEKAAQK